MQSVALVFKNCLDYVYSEFKKSHRRRFLQCEMQLFYIFFFLKNKGQHCWHDKTAVFMALIIVGRFFIDQIMKVIKCHVLLIIPSNMSVTLKRLKGFLLYHTFYSSSCLWIVLAEDKGLLQVWRDLQAFSMSVHFLIFISQRTIYAILIISCRVWYFCLHNTCPR